MTEPPVVVTGAPGWLGKRLVQALMDGLPEVETLAAPTKRQIRLLVVDENDSFVQKVKSDQRMLITPGDIRNKDSLLPLFAQAAGGTVFHIAGIIHPKCVKDFFDINVEGTKNMLEMAQNAGIKRFVHISSNSPIGVNQSADLLFDESAPYNPYMNYGKSKMMAEEAIHAASANMETVILRPPWFYGPGQPARQLLFFTMIKNGKVPLVGDGLNKRSMAYLDNICQGMLLAERSDAAIGQTYWIADRQPYTMNTIIDTIERLLEHDFGMPVAHKRMRLPGLASEVALAVDATLQGAGLYHQKIHVLSEMNKTIACNIAKAEKELGYDPKIALEEGMRRSIRSALDEGMVI